MQVYVWILLLLFEISLITGIIILLRNRKNPIHRLLFGYSAIIAVWAFTLFMVVGSETEKNAYFWFMVAVIRVFQPAIALHLSMIYIGRGSFFSKTKYFLLVYLPVAVLGLLYLYTDGFGVVLEEVSWGWKIISYENILLSLQSLFLYFLYNGLAIWLVIREVKASKSEQKKKQSTIVVISLIIPVITLLSVLLTRVIFGESNSIHLELSLLGYISSIILFAYAISKYRLLELSYNDVIDTVVETSPMVIILLKPDGEIVITNQSLVTKLGIRPIEVQRSNINKLLYYGNDHDGWKSIIEEISNTESISIIQREVRNSQGEKVPMSIQIQPIYEVGVLKGYVMILEDISKLKEHEKEIDDQKHEIEQEKDIRELVSNIYLRIREADNNSMQYILEDVITILREHINLADAFIIIGDKVISDPEVSVTSVMGLKDISMESLEKELAVLNVHYEKYPLADNENLENSFLIAIPGGKTHTFTEAQTAHMQQFINAIGAALENSMLGDKTKILDEITDRVIYMESDAFQKKARALGNESFFSTYLVATLDNAKYPDIPQDGFQQSLREILQENGAVWGNPWGYQVQSVFTDTFLSDELTAEIRAYKAAIEINRKIQEKYNYKMKIGIASGPLTVNKDTLQMSQLGGSKVIDKSNLSQESGYGVNTLQPPSTNLRRELETLGWEFITTKSIVRGESVNVWTLQHIPESQSMDKRLLITKEEAEPKLLTTSQISTKKELNYDETIRHLLTKGNDGHEHFEGSLINDEMESLIRSSSNYFKQNSNQDARFMKLTKVSHLEVLKSMEDFEPIDIYNQDSITKEQYKSSLNAIKLVLTSTPENIYKFTKATFENDLSRNSGLTKEIDPFMWIEMGLDYDECKKAYIRGIEDALKGRVIRGPLNIGVSIRRSNLIHRLADSKFQNVSEIEYPYLHSLELASEMKSSSISDNAGIFVNTYGSENKHPLFSYDAAPERGRHTETLYREINSLGLKSFVHTLENPFDISIDRELPRDYEFQFLISMFDKLDMKNIRFINLAHWSANLPHLEFIKLSRSEISACASGTHYLGDSHKPSRSFLLKKKMVIDGLLNDQYFPRILVSSDQSRPFGIRNIWQEIELTHTDVMKWFDEETANLVLIQNLRDSFENLSVEEIYMEYLLDKNAVEWVLAYDIYNKKSELKKKEIRKAASLRGSAILAERRKYV